VGDEVIGLFFGGISGPHHPAIAVAAAIDLAERAAQASTTPSMSIPVGTAVHTGVAFWATGLGTTVDDFTALGDVVNITARLASGYWCGRGDRKCGSRRGRRHGDQPTQAPHRGDSRAHKADRGDRSPAAGQKSVARVDRQQLEAWQVRLDEQGVTNSGIIEDENGLHLNAKDPDNIALEFFYMPPQG
jgi:hypothetical protein